jgi:predicted permease
MTGIVVQVTDVILPVLICVLVGFGLAKFKVPFNTKIIGALVANVGYPTLIISHLTAGKIEFGGFIDMLLAAAVSVVCFAAVGAVFLTLIRLPLRAFLSPMMLNNVGNIGLPIGLLAFGEAGLAYTMAFVVVVVVGIFTVGIWLPRGEVSLRDIATSPVIYAVVVTLIMMATGTHLPGPVDDAFRILGGLTIPLMLLTLGYTLATLRTGALWRGTYLALFHIAMAAGVAWGLMQAFGFTGTERGVFIVQCLMPVSVATYLGVELYREENAVDVAGFILISTLLTIVVLPLALAYWVRT